MARITRSFVHRISAVAALAVTTTAVALGTAAPANAATGFIHLTHNKTNLVLTADGLTAGAGVRLQLVSPAKNDFQDWSTRTNPGTAALTYVLKGKIKSGNTFVDGCLDLVADVPQPGKAIVVRPCDGTNSQRWLAVNQNGAAVEFDNKIGFNKLNVNNPTTGTLAVQGNVSNADQKFRRPTA
jgi:hypothetical protein